MSANRSHLPIRYTLGKDGASYSILRDAAEKQRQIPRMDHSSKTALVHPDVDFNRGVRRGDAIVVTGDKPRFALMGTPHVDKLDPQPLKLGDGRIRMGVGEREQWLDELPDVQTVFLPSRTEYTVPFSAQLSLRLTVSQAGDWGLVARLGARNAGAQPLTVTVQLVYGGLTWCPRPATANYFPPDLQDTAGTTISYEGGIQQLTAEGIPYAVLLRGIELPAPEARDGRLRYTARLDIPAGQERTVELIAGLCAPANRGAALDRLHSVDPGALIAEAEAYCDAILGTWEIATPNEVLDAGFRAGLLELDRDYSPPAWLEGIHYWAAYWDNNYQIPAAVSLGQIERARGAIQLFGLQEHELCPILMSSGKPYVQWVHGYEDGLPYFINAVVQYWQATADRALLEQLWPRLLRGLDHLWKVRDSDGDGLLDWHLGCNAFMYQADHLGMPGAAASPSLFMAGMMERLADLGEDLGHPSEAEGLRRRATRTYQAAMSALWDPDQGYFLNHVDLQGMAHPAHYYTDLVFPTLATSLPVEVRNASLAHLRDSLLLSDGHGEPRLMRVGDLKPSIFGNDNVMPVQMAEAARALCKEGDGELAERLLASVALAATIYTESPGSFPERMDDSGKGEANFVFGNPIGSFLFSVVDGLFGLALLRGGATLRWAPAFPESWDHASMRLPFAEVSFLRLRSTRTVRSTYRVHSPKPRQIDLSLWVPPCRIRSVRHNGADTAWRTESGPQRTHLSVTVQSVGDSEIVVEYLPIRAARRGPRPGKPARADGPLVDAAGVPGRLEPGSTVVPLDLARQRNTSTFWACSRWRVGIDYPIDLAALTGGSGELRTEAGRFVVPPSGPSMVRLERGRSDPGTRALIPGRFPFEAEIQVGMACGLLVLLYASEMESRHTDCAVGSLLLCYRDGPRTAVALQAGTTFTSLYGHFARSTMPVSLAAAGNPDDSLCVLALPCDESRVLDRLRVQIDVPDAWFGLVAANAVVKENAG